MNSSKWILETPVGSLWKKIPWAFSVFPSWESHRPPGKTFKPKGREQSSHSLLPTPPRRNKIRLSAGCRAPSAQNSGITEVQEQSRGRNFLAGEDEAQEVKSPRQPLAGAKIMSRTIPSVLPWQVGCLLPISNSWKGHLTDKTVRIQILIYHGNDWNNAHCGTKGKVSKESASSPFLSLTARTPYFCPELLPKILGSKTVDIVFPIRG